ncbi:uncharacterized protein [Oryza sativa Japonica Group]|uniref:Os08g0519600 protein n=4 Tax=Oryza TaxID=4527 RepID=Q6ZBK5_ORYSJ|nr:uncharacterized protein LOC4346057 [Oryza sativa Japonica Group]XP_015648396.1 uncharacterized protein LOC4346057 [Oryza sativa Japonica Group]EEC83897.1 hypothetical protein OsI_29907 [Oryza sativa Indica Group]KAB8109212.1 hypothetical protein EE612_045408 [Oryza sativa]KAF2920516.1 hypothetical protein DAI22_08g215100 [Oryza sativa Japonica Group]KAF2920517.1 hypothetical protein DAI22_08g215100 [Oryza sativa Japonica Group]BAD09694.1 unknown protein [Oryza sativa Japonica Group]|eukprot:NP_001062260.1 Os08g0519600 [Oryza sativa Japonica Group]
MDFFKIKKLGKARKSGGGGGEVVESEEETKAGNNAASDEQKGKILEDDPAAAAAGAGMDADAGNGAVEGQEEDDDDDDFITNEVKRRLKELRKNSFMVLIPEEECAEVEEDGEEEEEEGSSSREWMESDVGDGFPLCGFDSLYEKYCERMAVFDKMITQLLKDPGSFNISKKSPRSASKLASTLRNLSFKRRDDLQEDCEHLQQQQSEDDPYQTLETAYVGHVSLSWEALHCMYVHLSLILAAQPDNPTTYSCAAQAFQQFQVLLQRFVENEPFEQGSRVEIYARSRSSLSKLLQVPTFQVADGKYNAEDQVEPSIFASDLIKLLEESIMTFRLFLKKDKKKNSALMSVHSHTGSSIQQVQSSLDKKEVKVKELFKKKKGWKSKTWPATMEEVQLLFALIDIKVVSRVLRMAKLSKEQLLWCEEKMSKLDLSDNKLRRDGSPILFPC